MLTKNSRRYARFVCAVFVVMALGGLYSPALRAECLLIVDGMEYGTTVETEKTIPAAGQVYDYLFGSGCFNEPVESDVSCVSSYFDVMGIFCNRSVCISGGWSRGEGCTTSPGCMAFNIYEQGTWDVVCPTLVVKYKEIRAEKLTKARKVKLQISGDDTFDPYGEIDLGPLEVLRWKVRDKKGVLRVTALVPAGLEPQTILITIGECLGEIKIL